MLDYEGERSQARGSRRTKYLDSTSSWISRVGPPVWLLQLTQDGPRQTSLVIDVTRDMASCDDECCYNSNIFITPQIHTQASHSSLNSFKNFDVLKKSLKTKICP